MTTGPGGVSSNATGTIKYNVNKGETPKYSKNAYNSIPAYSVYPDNNSYTFVGWKKDGDTKVYSYDELMNIKFSVDTTFYAVWEEKEHNYGKLIAEKPAKCTEDGIKAHYECSLCHKLFIKENDKYIEKTADELKIKAAGHKYDQKVTTKKTLKKNISPNRLLALVTAILYNTLVVYLYPATMRYKHNNTTKIIIAITTATFKN